MSSPAAFEFSGSNMSGMKLVTTDPNLAAVDAGEKPWHQGHAGATNLTRGEVQRRCRILLENPLYTKRLERDLLAGTLPAAIEQMLWYYAYGKPVEQVNMSITHEDLSSLTIEQLQDRARALTRELEEAEALNNAIPAEFKVA